MRLNVPFSPPMLLKVGRVARVTRSGPCAPNVCELMTGGQCVYGGTYNCNTSGNNGGTNNTCSNGSPSC